MVSVGGACGQSLKYEESTSRQLCNIFFACPVTASSLLFFFLCWRLVEPQPVGGGALPTTKIKIAANF